jgi:hypothetical protein
MIFGPHAFDRRRGAAVVAALGFARRRDIRDARPETSSVVAWETFARA